MCHCQKMLKLVVILVSLSFSSSHSVRKSAYPPYTYTIESVPKNNDRYRNQRYEPTEPADETPQGFPHFGEHENMNDWHGWKGIPMPMPSYSKFHHRDKDEDDVRAVTTSRPNQDDYYQSSDDYSFNTVPTKQSRYGWQPRKFIPVRLVRKMKVKPTPRYVNRMPMNEQVEPKSHQAPIFERPAVFGQHNEPYEHQVQDFDRGQPTPPMKAPVEPQTFWQPIMREPFQGSTDRDREEDDDLIENHYTPPQPQRQPRRFLDNSRIKSSESRAQGVVVTGKDLEAEAGHHSGGHHGFFQYVRVPHKGAWEFGYRRGNHGHFTERHEQGHGHHFKTKVRWGDKHGGYGEHYWDYNHHGKSDHYDHHDDGHHGKHHHKFAAASNQDQVTSSSSSDSLSPSPSPRSPF